MIKYTKQSGTHRIKYSGAYYRPEDTKVAKSGWYVDKITTVTRPFETTVESAEHIWFATEDEAKAFDLKHNGDEE